MTETITQTSQETPIPGLSTVLVEFDQGIAWVTLNRPEKRNAVNPQLTRDMNTVLEALEADDRCQVLVLTGAGKSYCAGMDLKETFRESEGLSQEARMVRSRPGSEWSWRRLMYYMKPTICMVNGYCFGAGFNSLVACDLAIAAEEATFGLSEINWGIMPAGNVLKSVVSVMSQRDAMYYTMTGKTFNGTEAAQMKLVNQAVPLAKLRETTRELALELAAKNPVALRSSKHGVRRVVDMSWDDSMEYLMTKWDQMRYRDPEQGFEHGLSQFIDDKTYKPGFGHYRRDKK